MKEYKLTVGLEIHAELNTRTKMFCDSKNDPDEIRPNVNICPICMGYPGTLPVINREAVRSILRLGLAVGGKIADKTNFDRKNYFYPDIPKGYQISQYKDPLVQGGSLANVAITRVHLEEDTAKSIHGTSGESLLDFNRAGVSLMELVTEPVIHDAITAANFAKELQLLLHYLGIANANMEKGEMRIEANISISADEKFGTKVEVKNLNSFRSVEKAINFEFKRQRGVIERGEKVVQETRGWDENKEETVSQRIKEESQDYRYFPDPDLPSLSIKDIPDFSEDELRRSLPELPWQKRDRYKRKWGIKEGDIEVYVTNQNKAREFETVLAILNDVQLAQITSNYILTDLKRNLPASSVAEIIMMIHEGALSSRGAKDLLKLIPETETDIRKFAQENNLIQKNDAGELENIAKKIIMENGLVADEYRNGKSSSLQFLIGQAMKITKGSGNPLAFKKIFEKLLK